MSLFKDLEFKTMFETDVFFVNFSKFQLLKVFLFKKIGAEIYLTQYRLSEEINTKFNFLADDCSRGRREIGNDAISISMLREIIEESMRLFWEFLRVDKVASVKNVELQDPADLELMTNIQTNLQKVCFSNVLRVHMVQWKEKREVRIKDQSEKENRRKVKVDASLCKTSLRLPEIDLVRLAKLLVLLEVNFLLRS